MRTIQARLISQWYQPTAWFYRILVPISMLFRLVVSLRRYLYQNGFLRTHSLPVPVIVVGNITVGGTGKTPLVIALAERLCAEGYKPGIISRGYSGIYKDVCAVIADSDPNVVGDEPLLLAKRLRIPVFVGKKRVSAANALLAEHPSVNLLISDDGLQHYQLPRDIEIVVFDAARGLGNAHMLPAGPLREPLTRLKSADIIVHNGDLSNDMAGLSAKSHEFPVCFGMQLQGDQFVRLDEMHEKVSIDWFAGKVVHAIAGIGHPERFFASLRAMGMQVVAHAFPDHYGFRQQDLDALSANWIVMTEKDAMKCRKLKHPKAWYLPVVATIEETFFMRVHDLLKNLKKPQ